MDQFVKGKRKAIDEVAQTQAGTCNSKGRYRKYDEAYLALGFTHHVYTGCYSCRVAPQQLEAVYTGRDKATVANNFNFVSVRCISNKASV